MAATEVRPKPKMDSITSLGHRASGVYFTPSSFIKNVGLI